MNVKVGKTESDVNITTNSTGLNVNNFGSRDFVGFTANPAGRYFAVRIPAAQFQAINPGTEVWVTSVLYDTFVTDASVPAVYSEAMLTTGSIDPGTFAITHMDLANPLHKEAPFLAADNDFAPTFIKNPQMIGRKVRTLTDSGADLFMVLRLPTTTPFPGVSGVAPFVGLDGGVASNDAPLFGLSYISSDGGATWVRQPSFNFRFSLTVTEPTQ